MVYQCHVGNNQLMFISANNSVTCLWLLHLLVQHNKSAVCNNRTFASVQLKKLTLRPSLSKWLLTGPTRSFSLAISRTEENCFWRLTLSESSSLWWRILWWCLVLCWATGDHIPFVHTRLGSHILLFLLCPWKNYLELEHQSEKNLFCLLEGVIDYSECCRESSLVRSKLKCVQTFRKICKECFLQGLGRSWSVSICCHLYATFLSLFLMETL